MPRLVDVALPLPVSEPFTYHVPAELDEAAEPGMRAVVPFRRDVMTGVIVAVFEEGDRQLDFATRPIHDLPDPGPVFDTTMLSLTKWVAEYYLSTWGEALAAALPQGIERKSRWVVRPATGSAAATASLLAEHAPAQSKLLRIIADRGEITLNQLTHRYGDRDFRATLRALESAGHVEVADEDPGPAAKIMTESVVHLVREDFDEMGTRLGEQQKRLLHALKGQPEPVDLALITRAWGISRDSVKRLEKRGLVHLEEREVFREPDLGPVEPEPEHVLTVDQQNALDVILPRLAERSFAAILCHGVTGSGKTRLYMDAMQEAVEEGGGAVVLVPEISLTPQTVRRFKARFGDQVAVLHSRLSVGERYDAWRQIRAGRRRLVVGPRSAVFAPVQGLRLIVVDEEHDASYKQAEHDPRYHARDVAVVRGRMSEAVVLLGSATPSLESFHNAAAGKYTKVDLPRRVDDKPMPPVQIVDMNVQRAGGNWSSLSHPLRGAMAERIRRGEQMVILQNRRGFSPIVQCPECGHVLECGDCKISLSYHRAEKILKCHVCGNVRPLMSQCPECGGENLKYGGAGTQKVEDQIVRAFPDTPLIRMDQDTTRRKNAHHRLLEQFRQGRASILLGTQMVAKGLDFPGVTLVGVVNADIGLSLPDFRASERIFQLLTQVAGRTGRGEKSGEVIIQTSLTEHPAIRFAETHDVEGFVAAEMKTRKMLTNPPFGRLVLIRLRGQDPEKTQLAAEALGRAADKVRDDDIELLGPVAAPIERIKKFWRWHLTLRGTNGRKLRALATELRERHGRMKHARSVQMVVDVDPWALL